MLVDPERIEGTNPRRAVGATRWDARTCVDPLQASILFNWLSEQCYVNVGARGLSPHDLVRDVVDEDLRWRDPEGSRELDGALNRCLLRQLRDGRHDSHTAMELQFLERNSALMKRYFDFGALGSVSIGAAIAVDRDGIARLRDAGLPPARERDVRPLVWASCHPDVRSPPAKRHRLWRHIDTRD
jgi:hypothetical protein